MGKIMINIYVFPLVKYLRICIFYIGQHNIHKLLEERCLHSPLHSPLQHSYIIQKSLYFPHYTFTYFYNSNKDIRKEIIFIFPTAYLHISIFRTIQSTCQITNKIILS